MTGRYRPPAPKSASRVTPTTICQKCLQRDTYECTASAQSRPYTARPSRTQQLLNPDLRPKLTADSLESRDAAHSLAFKTGLADAILKNRQAQRRSPSPVSDDDSASTVSTTRGRSPSPPPLAHPDDIGNDEDNDAYMTSQTAAGMRDISPMGSPEHGRKRRRPSSSSVQSRSTASADRSLSWERKPLRHTRRRVREESPGERGRRGRRDEGTGTRRRERMRTWDEDQEAWMRRKRDVHGGGGEGEQSPDHTPKQRHFSRRSHSRSRSASPHRDRKRHDKRRHSSQQRSERRHRKTSPPTRQRSLSPYSKRLALTQAMSRV